MNENDLLWTEEGEAQYSFSASQSIFYSSNAVHLSLMDEHNDSEKTRDRIPLLLMRKIVLHGEIIALLMMIIII